MKRNLSETKQRFTIKKFKIGAASVLVGTVFAAFASQGTVQANEQSTLPSTEEVNPQAVLETEQDQEPTNQDVETAPQTQPVDTAEQVAPSVDLSDEHKSEVSAPVDTVSVDPVVESKPETPAPTDTPKEQTPAKPKYPVVRFSATNTVPTNPANNAQARPENEGQAIPTNKAFRDVVSAEKVPVSNGITADAKIDVADRVKNNTEASLNYRVDIAEDTYHAGDTLTIRFDELGVGHPFSSAEPQKELVSDDGIVYATLTKKESNYITYPNPRPGNPGATLGSAYQAQRNDAFTATEKLDHHIRAEGFSTTYTYTFNENIEGLKNIYFGKELKNSIYVPRVQEDVPIVGRISVNGVPIVEKTMTIVAEPLQQVPVSDKFSFETTGTIYLNKEGEITSVEPILNLKSGKRIDQNSILTIDLNENELSKFIKTGDHGLFTAQVEGGFNAPAAIVNENKVILFAKRTSPKFQVVELAEDKLSLKLVEGTMEPGLNYRIRPETEEGLKGGFTRIFTEPTYDLVNEAIKKGEKGVSLSGGRVTLTKPDGQKETAPETQNVNWSIYSPVDLNAFSGAIPKPIEGNAIMRYIEETTGKVIIAPKAIVNTKENLLVDKFATTVPQENFNEISTNADNKTVIAQTEADGVKTYSATAPFLIKDDAGNYYSFTKYTTDNKYYGNSKTEGVISLKQANVVANYKKLAFGSVTVNYVIDNEAKDKLQEPTVTKYNGQADDALTSLEGKPYDVTTVVAPTTLTKEGIVYELKSEAPTNLSGTLTNGNTDVYYLYVEKQPQAVVKFFEKDGATEKALADVADITTKGRANTAIPDATVQSVADKIVELTSKGYELVSNDLAQPQTFGTDVNNPKEFKVVVTEKLVDVPTAPKNPTDPVGPNNPNVPANPDGTPVQPGQPINPNNPDGPKWTEELINKVTNNINASVTRTVKYVKENTSEEVNPTEAPAKESYVSFTRPFKVNLVTGDVTFDENWNYADAAKTDLAEATSPAEINGAGADKGQVFVLADQKLAKVAKETVTPEQIKEIVARLQAADPNAKLVEAKPAVEVPYKNAIQHAVIIFVEDQTNTELGRVNETGNTGTPISKIAYQEKLDELKKKYNVKEDGFKNPENYDELPGEQTFTVVLTPKVLDVDPNDPANPTNPNDPTDKTPVEPGTPVDPTNPNSDNWPTANDLNKKVVRTITYKDEAGNEVKTPTTQEALDYVRTAKVNLVTGKVEYGEWTPKDSAKVEFPEVTDLVVTGYLVKEIKANPGVDLTKVASQTPTKEQIENGNVVVEVIYAPIGKYVPKVPEGYETPELPVYPNDPNDPTKPLNPTDPDGNPTPNYPVIPHVPGLIPQGPDGNPLKPVDPKDPKKGYIPPVPATPGEDTNIEYIKAIQDAVIKFVVEGTEEELAKVEEKGESDTTIPTANYQAKLAELKAKYNVVSDEFAGDKKFDKDTTKPDTFTVVLSPKVLDVDPNDPANPTNPNDPTDKTPVEPGTPVDPTNPNSDNWPTANDLNKKVVRTITYKDEAGNEVKAPTTQESLDYVRTAKVNLVTGKVEYGEWRPKDSAKVEFPEVSGKDLVVEGYLLKEIKGSTLTKVDKHTPTKEQVEKGNIEVEVIYKAIGKVRITTPDGKVTEKPYPNDPTDPTKPAQPTDVIPHIPGTTPVGPNGQPLEPVDPKDPTQGYKPPVIDLDNPADVTPITYEKDTQKAIITIVDKDGNKVPGVDAIEETGKSGEPIPTDNLTAKLAELIAKGYVVESNELANPTNFDEDKDKDQNFLVKVTIPVIDVPVGPKDPSQPVGPNNPIVPTNPDGTPIKPGQPINPDNPEGPKWTEEKINEISNNVAKTITRTIKYVKNDGSQAADDATDSVTFTRPFKINGVTGEVTYSDTWSAVNGKGAFVEVKSHVIPGYYADKALVPEKVVTEKDTDSIETVTYKPLGNIVITTPDGNTITIPYPNDPTDPTKPGQPTDVIPYVPGFVPVGPDGQPLEPVDPTDPTKGYKPPVINPDKPGDNTPISYVPLKPVYPSYPGNSGVPTPSQPGGQTPANPAPNAPVDTTSQVPTQPVSTVSTPSTTSATSSASAQSLPNTGQADATAVSMMGVVTLLGSLGLVAKKRRRKEN